MMPGVDSVYVPMGWLGDEQVTRRGCCVVSRPAHRVALVACMLTAVLYRLVEHPGLRLLNRSRQPKQGQSGLSVDRNDSSGDINVGHAAQ
jgi:hypothetical protein